MKVLLFAAAREAVGCGEIDVSVASDATVSDVFEAIAGSRPELADLLPACRLAVDSVYVDADDPVSPDGEVALIPPVSGG